MNIVKTTTHKGTWLGESGTSTTHHLDKKRDGLRIAVLLLASGKATVRKISGDGRNVDFKLFATVETNEHGIDAAVHSMLNTKNEA